VVDGRQDGILLATGQALNLLQPLQHLAAGLALLDDLRGRVDQEKLLNGYVEGGGETQGDFGGEAKLADLVIGDDDLDDVDALGEFGLLAVYKHFSVVREGRAL
jgi:hypothetical protein